MDNDLLDGALHYAQTGFAVFPVFGVNPDTLKCDCGNDQCANAGKHPLAALAPRGCLDATNDIDTITDWWTRHPNANVGVATGAASNLIVIDVDRDKGGDVMPLLEMAPLDTLRITTGGGWHYYFEYDGWDEFDIRNSVGRLAPHVDVRGTGGYVVAPPSLHASGAVYAADRGSNMAPLPNAFLDAIKAITADRNATADAKGVTNIYDLSIPAITNSGLILPENIDAGKRNNELTRLAGALRRHGLSEGALIAALNIENQRICKPPLPDSEIFGIAHSTARYAPNEVLERINEDGELMVNENALKPRLLGDLLNDVFEKKDIIAFHLGKRDIGILQGETNAGKTTFLRNVALCMAAGRPFLPFFDGTRPVKICYFDFENDASDVQRDMRQMVDKLTPLEMEFVSKNFIVVPKGMVNDTMFQFNTHEQFASDLITENGAEFAFIDNISAAYDLNDENSNAEVTRKIVKPLLRMAIRSNCAFLFAHHYGKTNKHTSEDDKKSPYAGRGASALPSLARSVFNIFGKAGEGDPVTVHCAKRKSDGGNEYSEVFELREDRWFYSRGVKSVPIKPRSAYEAVRSFFRDYAASEMPAKKVIECFEGTFDIKNIQRAIWRLTEDGFIRKVSRGIYQWMGDTLEDLNRELE